MPIKITHIGEPLVKALADSDLNRFYERCKLGHVPVADRRVKIELKLAPWGGREFDPVGRVDLGIWVGPRSVTPVEIKLGWEGLSRSDVQRMLGSWSESAHYDPRWKGSMMAILDRHYPQTAIPLGTRPQPLKVIVDQRKFLLTKKWIVIARQEVIDEWRQKPALFQNTRFVAIEKLVAPFGEKRFNKIVAELVDFNPESEVDHRHSAPSYGTQGFSALGAASLDAARFGTASPCAPKHGTDCLPLNFGFRV